MSLAAVQHDFLAQVLDEDAAMPPHWSARERTGMAIYRNAYRAQLVGALGETFPAVKAWVGDESFARAAAHHAIVNPPSSWSLDHLGAGFDETLEELFANDPEVAELAWLEWHMHLAFVARDAVPLDQAGLAAAIGTVDPEDIAALRFTTLPGLAARRVSHDIPAIWTAATSNAELPSDYRLAEAAGIVVWREGLRSVFRPASAGEADCLALAAGGATFGEVCALLGERRADEASAAAAAGEMLTRWICDGMLAAIGPRKP
ncbi:hypothetical protein A6F68_01245 [Tsuneonella dongtanensis]|uniref:Putative DNA-binding domain-containing protein n=1 Tax=Tsuneonella dongtanensis TaxID=692370 RepID=A0A1B2AC69_9SPHN|nr:DNA-binding domain-containing protein [Tsuneonella dongtanensis]ANY19762.1 hypothetical protein A6F68_01245 [Tsuneonella dongtanensis]